MASGKALARRISPSMDQNSSARTAAGNALPEEAVALERLLARRRALSARLLSLDGYDRWGARTPEDHGRVQKESGKALAEQSSVTRELEALVAQLRFVFPEAVSRWAGAHVALLDRYVGEVSGSPDEGDGTERFVAEGERRQWEEVAQGSRALVEENTHYVRHDRTLYRAVFGFDPA